MEDKIMDRKAPIGVFDSGVGGLTVAREIMRQIPNERIVYLGTYGRILDTQTFRNTCSASNIQALVTGNSQYSKMFYGD